MENDNREIGSPGYGDILEYMHEKCNRVMVGYFGGWCVEHMQVGNEKKPNGNVVTFTTCAYWRYPGEEKFNAVYETRIGK
jgi:hypothetical protein